MACSAAKGERDVHIAGRGSDARGAPRHHVLLRANALPLISPILRVLIILLVVIVMLYVVVVRSTLSESMCRCPGFDDGGGDPGAHVNHSSTARQ
jgi:hypothetical protein